MKRDEEKREMKSTIDRDRVNFNEALSEIKQTMEEIGSEENSPKSSISKRIFTIEKFVGITSRKSQDEINENDPFAVDKLDFKRKMESGSLFTHLNAETRLVESSKMKNGPAKNNGMSELVAYELYKRY